MWRLKRVTKSLRDFVYTLKRWFISAFLAFI